MAKRPSSRRWLEEHRRDPYVQAAARQGYRSRAAYKLMELDERDRLFRPGMRVLDLGAAPGGWAQVALNRIGAQGRLIATDILPMQPLAGVDFVEGDFTRDETLTAVLALTGGAPLDLVLSDLAPNMSGTRAVDQARAMGLTELAADCAAKVLRPGGSFVAKVFMGEGSDAFIRGLRSDYGRVVTRKPDASRDRSREVYVVARDFRGAGAVAGQATEAGI
ncbi:MAG TPA: 23S rRNA methyltransferase [Gammaproteobacteria bacterium]|nr:23S rRNA methyltransferase [Gammaproteobacteria bacterium]